MCNKEAIVVERSIAGANTQWNNTLVVYVEKADDKMTTPETTYN